MTLGAQVLGPEPSNPATLQSLRPQVCVNEGLDSIWGTQGQNSLRMVLRLDPATISLRLAVIRKNVCFFFFFVFFKGVWGLLKPFVEIWGAWPFLVCFQEPATERRAQSEPPRQSPDFCPDMTLETWPEGFGVCHFP